MIIIIDVKLARAIQLTFFNVALHTLYNSCKQLTKIFLE